MAANRNTQARRGRACRNRLLFSAAAVAAAVGIVLMPLAPGARAETPAYRPGPRLPEIISQVARDRRVATRALRDTPGVRGSVESKL